MFRDVRFNSPAGYVHPSLPLDAMGGDLVPKVMPALSSRALGSPGECTEVALGLITFGKYQNTSGVLSKSY